MKACGETVMDQYVIAKTLCSLIPRFDNIVMEIEESKDLATMSKEELQSSLEAHEQMMEERNNDKAKTEITLQGRFRHKIERKMTHEE